MPIDLAVRLGVGATRLGLRIAGEAVKLPLKIAGGLLGHEDAPQEQPAPTRPAPTPQPEQPAPPQPRVESPPAPAVEAPPVVARPPADQPPTTLAELEDDEPVHIEPEVELVGEFSEVGAEEGAGASIHVDPPWDGYSRMKVAEIQQRLEAASQAELAVVQLYEGTHRNRRSVLDAVERRSKALGSANGR